VSVGHVARVVESAGIATTCILIEAFAHYAEAMRIPRAVITRHPMGRPVGPPGDAETQRAVVGAALGLIEGAAGPGSVLRLPGAYRPGQ
jgi:hypothetical protein